MKYLKLRTFFNPWAFLFSFVFMFAVTLAGYLSAQPTNSHGVAAPATVFDNKTLLMLAISLVTPFCVRGLAELGLPKKLLPLTTPLIGCAIGAALNWLADAGLAGLDMATAGGLAVAVREAWDQNVAKMIRSRDDWQKLDEDSERTDNKTKTDDENETTKLDR